MVFLEDSIFLNLVRGEREHQNYGITHTIKNILVDENFRLQIMASYKYDCRVCNSEELVPIISLGKVPLANNLIENVKDIEINKKPRSKNKPSDHTPIEINIF